MSKILGTKQYLLNSQLGNVVVTSSLIKDYDVEDIIHLRAISEAQAIEYINIGQMIDVNSPLPPDAIPSVFQANTVGLD